MAIGLARPEYVSRSSGSNACCKSAYNARSKIIDNKTGEVFNWVKRDDNVFHEIMLPEHVNNKFKDISVFSNEVERAENRKDSQLYVEWILALAKDEDGVDLEFRIETVKEFIKRKGWVEEGLGVQVDIHKPHEGDINWHAHLLVTTRRFTKDGKGLDIKKARDLQPVILNGMVQNVEELQDSLLMREIQNEQFKARGMSNRVDLPGELKQEHVGPVRMRSIFNEAERRNEERREAEIEHLNSGSRVLEKVTKHMSVFTKGDLSRAVKYIPDSEVRAKLVEDAISDKSIIALYREEGSKTKYFTTTGVRDEENKILRLSGYVANLENSMSSGGKITRIANELVSSSTDGLTEEQHKALSAVLLSDSGLRILRGRAGAGKSYVLGTTNRIATMSGVNVIGLAPTHKARLALVECGYERVDTVKGMLFKLANGRFDLPKHSLLVVDEAGMVGNDDYRELLRVAATRKCNVVLAGDERQLASVSRGGMFEVFAGKYGSSTILDIQRQSGQWGKSVAMSMSEGRVESAISILENENRIKWDKNSHSSMESLIKDWNKSEYNIGDRLILAVKNSDVAALNHGVRQYLKLSGDLKGEEFAVAGNHYMQGDRVLITKTDKELGLVNGDLAEITHASGNKFTIKLSVDSVAGSGEEGAKEISFNPSEYSGFRHGYATTVFKAQGASIKDVFVYHNGFAGIRNSYVAMSRMVEELKLYTNKESTTNLNSLIGQLSHDAEAGSSLAYLTESEFKYKELGKDLANDSRAYVRGINKFIDFVGSAATKLADKYISSSEYYNYREPKGQYESVSQVIDRTYAELEGENIQEEKLVVGGYNQHISNGKTIEKTEIGHNSTLNSLVLKDSGVEGNDIYKAASSNSWQTKESAKTRFYRNADRIRAIRDYSEQKEEWAREYEQLKSEVKFKAEYLARDLLGEPNKKLSNGRELRYGEHGKIAVRIAGEKAGTWYDFAKGEGGDMFALVQERRGYNFKQAADYLRSSVGMSVSSNVRANLKLVDNHREKDRLEAIAKERREQEKQAKAKALYVEKLEVRSKDVGERSVAHRYLSETRGINVDLGLYIKTAGIYDRHNKVYRPALIAFAKDAEGKVIGGQHIVLDKKTNNKAKIAIAKKSFGKIAGSFVDLGNVSSDKVSSTKSSITIISEGVETGLSIKQSMCEHSEMIHRENTKKVLCSLGISNIKNYEASIGEKIIIAADNDGISSNTSKTIEAAKNALEEKGAFVEIVKPSNQGDFNDVLKSEGSNSIAKAFESALTRHTATTLGEYVGKDTGDVTLDKNDESNLSYIEKYDLPQGSILAAYRKGNIYGKLELEQVRKGLEVAVNHFSKNKEILEEASQWGYEYDKKVVIKSMIGMEVHEAKKTCIGIRDDHLSKHLLSHFEEFRRAKSLTIEVDKLKPIIRSEQQFLKETYESLGSPIEEYKVDIWNVLRSGELVAKEPEILDKVFKLADSLYKDYGKSEYHVSKDLKVSNVIQTVYKELEAGVEISKAYNQPEELEKARGKSYSVKEIFTLIEKEQNHLADLHGNIKYYNHDKELLAKLAKAHEQREDNTLNGLKELARNAIASRVVSQEWLIEELRQTTDVKASSLLLEQKIEYHYVNSNLAELSAAKEVVKGGKEAMVALNKEQHFLSKLHNNLKYPEVYGDELVAKCRYAHEVVENKDLAKLYEKAKESIASGAKTEEEIVKELQQSKDFSKSCKTLDKEIEAHNINSQYRKILEERQKVETPQAAISLLGKEQNMWLETAKNLRYQDHLPSITDNIAMAQSDHQNNTLQELCNTANHVIRNNIIPYAELTKHFTSNDSVTEIHQNMRSICHEYHLDTINQHLSQLHKDIIVHHDDHKFECPIKYLEHWKNNVDHKLIPIREIDHRIEQEKEHIHEIDHSPSL